MTNHIRFGPAGVPPFFRLMGAKLPDVPLMLRQEKLDAFEYQASRWGQTPQIKKEVAEQLYLEAKRNDVAVSVHGSYFLNFAGKKEVVEASKRRLIACVTAAQWMGANVAVFHPGFYSVIGKANAFKNCTEALQDVVKAMDSLGICDVKLGPETMGKHSQIGSLEEVLTLCETVDKTKLVIDWAHLHARSGGQLQTAEDFHTILSEVETRLGSDATKGMHCHFSKVEFTKSGERRHHVLDDKRFGPTFEPFAEVISDFKLCPVVICETPLLDRDAVKMRNIYLNAVQKPSNQ